MENRLPNQDKIDAIKIIVCDLDGTLLNHNKEIPQKTCGYLISLQKKGYTLILASGRFYYELQPYIKQLKMEQYHGFAVCANGLEIHDLSDQSQHSFTKISKDEAAKIIEAAKKDGITSYINYNNQYHTYLCFTHKIPIYTAKMLLYPFQKVFENNHFVRGLYTLRFDKHIGNEIGDLHKICFLSSKRKLKKFEHKINAWNQPYVFYFVNPRAIEITHNSVGKYEALQYICEKKKLTINNVMAFGDSGNDLNLVKHAGIGVAMKNAFPEAKAVTSYQTFKNNQNEGIYDYLKQLDM